jgi:hypothetical protein
MFLAAPPSSSYVTALPNTLNLSCSPLSTTIAAGRHKYVVDLSRNVYLIVADLLVGIITRRRCYHSNLVAFTMGGESPLFGKMGPRL